MSNNAVDYAAALRKLDEEFLRRFPGIDRSDPKTSDRMLVDEGKISEAQLIRIYSDACGVDFVEEDEESEFEVIKTKRISVKPMFVEEAILQMNLLNHEFFVFKNAETSEIDIVYKRKDGKYGIIETN